MYLSSNELKISEISRVRLEVLLGAIDCFKDNFSFSQLFLVNFVWLNAFCGYNSIHSVDSS